MTSIYEIVIQIDGTQSSDFVVFQEQPSYTNSGPIPQIFSNSLGTGHLAPHIASGSQLRFPYEARIYAGAQTNNLAGAQTNNLFRVVQMQPVEFSSRPIALADGTTQPANNTTMTLDPFGLSVPGRYRGRRTSGVRPSRHSLRQLG